MKKCICLLCILLVFAHYGMAQPLLTTASEAGAFPVVSKTGTAAIVYDAADDSLVQKVARLLQQDVEAVTGKKPVLTTTLPKSGSIILIGNVQHSALLRQLVNSKKWKAAGLQNKWEAYQIQTVNNPFNGIGQALVIAGSDRRGTAYGVFELSRQMGVSPWSWWADVPVQKKAAVYIRPSANFTDAPNVKYRGIFINDEAPALSGWSKEKFGGFNHLFYEKVFELILRLKGNYLWPAMWGSAFYDDDPLNKQMADNWGVVIGTSHHEPLMRAHDEWRRYGQGKWNYDSNSVKLQQFWKEGMQRATNEKIVSIGMRGDGDEPMSRETATALLERIVADQRKIIENVTGRPAAETPQLWALYKEVQDYYDKGMRVPDDVTLLLCDDNWGNLRKLPKPTDKVRSGGYGIYYHFDYVGGPRNYKWINTNNLARVWEQMHLAYEHGVKNIWIVNVGDIKPMELPTSFFLDYAWNPARWTEDNLRTYYTQWASQQFSSTYANEIGNVLRRYSQYSARRKPELLDAATYSLTNYNEWDNVLAQWLALEKEAENIGRKLPAEMKDAYFQLVLHPVLALTNLHQLYAAVAKNKFYATENPAKAAHYADEAENFYRKDSLLTIAYHQIANGKWNHMMDQTHIGYTYWQQPEKNKMPAVVRPASQSAGSKAERATFGQLDSAVSRLQEANEKLIYTNNSAVKTPFVERNGVVSIEAPNWTRVVNSKNIQWKVIPDIGRDGSGITTFPVTATTTLNANSPHVEYDFYTQRNDSVKLHLQFSPTLNFYNAEEGLQFAISIDNETPQVVSLNKEDKNSISGIWNKWVAENIIVKTSKHNLNRPGRHTLKYWAISPAVVLQKIVLDFGNLKPSFLGPPETILNK